MRMAPSNIRGTAVDPAHPAADVVQTVTQVFIFQSRQGMREVGKVWAAAVAEYALEICEPNVAQQDIHGAAHFSV